MSIPGILRITSPPKFREVTPLGFGGVSARPSASGLETPQVVTQVKLPKKVEAVAIADGHTEITLPSLTTPENCNLYINGLFQPKTTFTLLSLLVTIPDTTGVVTGDYLVVEYYPVT